eukprot:2726157-Prymnesium_polylepis.1
MPQSVKSTTARANLTEWVRVRAAYRMRPHVSKPRPEAGERHAAALWRVPDARPDSKHQHVRLEQLALVLDELRAAVVATAINAAVISQLLRYQQSEQGTQPQAGGCASLRGGGAERGDLSSSHPGDGLRHLRSVEAVAGQLQRPAPTGKLLLHGLVVSSRRRGNASVSPHRMQYVEEVGPGQLANGVSLWSCCDLEVGVQLEALRQENDAASERTSFREQPTPGRQVVRPQHEVEQVEELVHLQPPRRDVGGEEPPVARKKAEITTQHPVERLASQCPLELFDRLLPPSPAAWRNMHRLANSIPRDGARNLVVRPVAALEDPLPVVQGLDHIAEHLGGVELVLPGHGPVEERGALLLK